MEANLVIRFTTGRTKTEPPGSADHPAAGCVAGRQWLGPQRARSDGRSRASAAGAGLPPARAARACASDHGLVNEAFVRLVGWQEVKWQNRAHFIAMAAQLMRHILVDIARRRARSADGPVCWWSISLTPSRPSRTAPEI